MQEQRLTDAAGQAQGERFRLSLIGESGEESVFLIDTPETARELLSEVSKLRSWIDGRERLSLVTDPRPPAEGFSQRVNERERT